MSISRLPSLTILTVATILVATTTAMVLTVSAHRTDSTVSMTRPASTPTQPKVELAHADTGVTTEMSASNTSVSATPVTAISPDTQVALAAAPTPKNHKPTKNIPKPQVPVSPTPTPSTKPGADPTTVASPTAFTEAFSQRVWELTNEFRQSEGLRPLAMNTALTSNASRYSAAMLTSKRLAHTDMLGCDLTCRFARDGFEAQSWGENLAHYSFEDEPTVEEVAQFFMREWKKSAGHRANLISPDFTQTGIGIAKNSTSIYVAVHFARP